MAKRTLDRRTEQIPDLIEERKKGKICVSCYGPTSGERQRRASGP